MRSCNRKISSLFLFAVVLLIFQAGIQLLHHHYSDSYHDGKDGFHTLSTALTCPATGAHSNMHSDTPSQITSSFVYSTPLINCNDVTGSDIKRLFSTSPVSGVGCRASPA